MRGPEAKTPITRLDPLLFGALAILLLLHLPNLPAWVGLFIVQALVWRAVHDRGQQAGSRLPRLRLPLPNKAFLGTLLILMSLFTYVQFSTVLGRDAGTSLFVITSALKVLETRTLREARILALLGFFLLLTHFLFSQEPLQVLLLLLPLALLLGALLGFGLGEDRSLTPRARLSLAGRLLLPTLPLMLALFVLFPRPPGPLWGVHTPEKRAVTGLSDHMEPGQISRLTLSGELAFRANFDGPPPPPAQRYWRGPVLWNYDGKRWTRMEDGIRPPPVEDTLGEPLHYTITLEPHGQNWLFALDIPVSVPRRSRLTRALELAYFMPLEDRLRYEVSSNPDYRLDTELSRHERRAATALPDGLPRLKALAATWRAQSTRNSQIIEQALQHFNREPFRYTLTPDTLPPEGGMDHFLFDTRNGFCEHYASAFVLLMRAAGLPARVVTGYLGGEYNPDGQYLIVRQSDAHAWAEVWLENEGWVRIDPTAAIAPNRIEMGLAGALEDPSLLSASDRREPGLIRWASLKLDAGYNAWNEWVLGYGPEQQQKFLETLGLREIKLFSLALLTLLAAGLLIAGGLLLSRHWPARLPRDPVEADWQRIERRLAHQGLERQNGETVRQFTQRIARMHPHLRPALTRTTDLYLRLNYARTPGASTRLRFREAARALQRELRLKL